MEQPIPAVTARNFYFDRTSYKLISKLISERGVLEQPNDQGNCRQRPAETAQLLSAM